ncbi:J domain-containing protein [Kribbella sp. NPDC002412]
MTAPPLDPYAILGVTVEASDDDLDHAFRGLVRQLHPDTRTAASDDDADRRLQELLNAYATLRDPIRRAAYDRAMARAAVPSAPSPRPRRSQAAPARYAPIRVDPAIRVGPVRWEPPAQGGKHDGTR